MWGLPGRRPRDVAHARAREPREGRRHHDLGRADLVPDRHHRADRVRVPVRRAGAVRRPRRARRASRTSSASSSASGTARRSRTGSSTSSSSTPNSHARVVAALARTAVGRDVLPAVPHDDPQGQPRDAGPRAGRRERDRRHGAGRGAAAHAARRDAPSGHRGRRDGVTARRGVRRGGQHPRARRVHHAAARGPARSQQGERAGAPRRSARPGSCASGTACRRSSGRAPRT